MWFLLRKHMAKMLHVLRACDTFAFFSSIQPEELESWKVSHKPDNATFHMKTLESRYRPVTKWGLSHHESMQSAMICRSWPTDTCGLDKGKGDYVRMWSSYRYFVSL